VSTYTVLHTLISGVADAVTVAPTVVPLANQTSGSVTDASYSQGATLADSALGDSDTITRLLALGAIQLTS